MANVGFKLGSQAKANLMLTNPDQHSVEEGSFYLTSDTHRLYIGALPTTTADDGTVTTKPNATPRLFPLNEGIVTVQTLNHLPVFSVGTPEELAAIGTFYYVEDGNILCIYGGTREGNGWIQVNTNTDTNISGITYKAGADGEYKVTLTLALMDSNNVEMQAKTAIELRGGIKTGTYMDDRNVEHVFLEADTYTLLLKQNEDIESSFDITLDSSTGQDSVVTLVGGTDITLSKDPDANILYINSDQSSKIQTVTVGTGEHETLSEGNGFRVTLTQNNNEAIEGWFNPKIQYGVDKTDLVTFKNGTAILEAYTANEIKSMLKELNSMHYMGTIGINGSVAQRFSYDGNGLKIMTSDDNEVRVKIGDMFIVSDNLENPSKTGVYYGKGTILICNSKTGEEDSDGYIPSSELELESIESTLDSDTTYTLTRIEPNDKNGFKEGFVLRSKNSGDYGTFYITTPNPDTPVKDGILMSYEWSGTSERPVGTLTLQHAPIGTSVINSDQPIYQTEGADLTIPIVKEVKTDGLGHIVEVVISNYVVKDTISHIERVTTSTHAYESTKNDKPKASVGVIKSTVTTKTSHGAEKAVDGYVNIVSQTLQIGTDNTYESVANGNKAEAGISINMVWGEF